MRKSGGNGADENFYSSSVLSLLKAPTSEEFEKLLGDAMERWSPAFEDYYLNHIHDAVTASCAISTSHLDVVTVPYMGVTNNPSESYNRVLKDFQNWKVNLRTSQTLLIAYVRPMVT